MPSNDSADAPSRKRPHSPSDTSDKRTKAKPQPDTAQTQGNNILIWFRSDLRTRDNPALEHALKLAEETKRPSIVFAVYIVSPSEFHSHDVGAVKVDFILRNLSSLSSRLWNPHRIPLLLKTSTTGANVIQDLKNLCQDLSITHVFANKEFEVDESRRDSKCFDLFAKQGISFHLFQDQCVVPPGQLKSKSANSIYTVYSPFKRRWLDVVKNEKNKYLTLAKALTDFKAPINSEDSLKSVEIEGPDAVPSSLKGFELDQVKKFDLSQFWPAGEDIALRNLATFCRGVSMGTAVPAAITKYDSNRNIPNLETGTSRLSPYLAAGVLSTKQCVLEAMESNGGKLDSGSSGTITWIQELIWRDFYRNILVAFPHVCKNKPFKLETMNIEWIFDEGDFDAWTQGRTGYPIVDAGMRQLQKTGWMHNRVRMIAASFLTKHLLHNWQHGEKFFANSLIDGDFASNNGGWQWVASTGTDAQPYFRIFNPYSQSVKFDPDGIYIRRWVPELAHLKTSAAVHNPHSVLSRKELITLGYPEKPMVDHKMARERAIDAFKIVMGKNAKPPHPSSAQAKGNHDYVEMETKGNSKKTKVAPALAKGKVEN